MKIDEALDTYQRGDADKRIGLCLSYPDFREEFGDIEQDMPMDLEMSGEDILKNSTLSMKVFAVYLATLSSILLFRPSFLLLLGFENISNPWVPILGYIVGALAFYFFMAARERAKNFYAWTAIARFPLLPFFTVLVAVGMAPPVMLLIGLIDTGCAIWTAYSLKNERRNSERRGYCEV